jgi:peptidoglycan/xylan/chitin deacetylase (PgdA/CDA1 family)
MRLIVEFPVGYDAEHSYVAQCLLGDFLGLEYEAYEAAAQERVRIHDGMGRELLIAADLFARPPSTWLTAASLPREPLAWWDTSDIPTRLDDKRLPVLYGKPGITRDETTIRMDPDIFGTCFFFLARYEEVVGQKRDAHGRFAAVASLSSRCGLMMRPIVDEYVEVLWACLHALWPGLRRRPRAFRQNLTHDVDQLHFVLPRLLAGDLKHRRFKSMSSNVKLWLSIKAGRAADPCDTFERIMDVSDAAGAVSTFNFITKWSHPLYDPAYFFKSSKSRALLKRISARGHQIGLHASYGSYDNGGQIAREFATLKRVCGDAGISQNRWGARQHFLRWRTPDTFQHLENAGLDYDSTLGYADAAGFRCGTCHDFLVFNVRTRRTLRLRERPLIAMDASVMNAEYQNLGASTAAFDYLKALKDICRRYDGEFTLLWHNTRLSDSADERLYRAIVAS